MPDVISLPQLLDLSLGTPELGAVNFNQLHKLLLEIINRLDLSGHPVPLPDIDAKREAKAAATPGYQKSSYHALSDKVSKIERDLSDMSTAVPDSKDLIAKIKTDSPLTDLWQHMQRNKRVESNEDGIKTAMGLIEQLIKDMEHLKKENKELRGKLDKIDMDDINKQLARLNELSDRMRAMSELTDKLKDVDAHKAQLDDLQSRLDALPAAEEIVTWPGLQDALSGVKGEFAAYRPESRVKIESEKKVTPVPASSATDVELSTDDGLLRPASRPRSTLSDGPSLGLVDVLERLGTVDKRHDELKKRVEDLEREIQNKANKEDVSNKLPDDLMDMINDMNAKLSQLDELRAKLVDDSTLSKGKLNKSYSGDRDAESVKRLQSAMSELRDDLANLQKLIDLITKENKENAKQIEQLTETTARLDLVKADKEFVEAELDAKADKSQVDGKINRSVFDSTVGDLQKMIDDLLAKLLAYEDAWKQAHTKVEEDVDGKIDRMELDRLKSYLDRKLRELNSKLKQNSGMFNPFCEDAAGLKKQLLPFNCLSCDKPVVVSNAKYFAARNQLTQSTPGPLGDAFASNKSTRPYTTFELDQIRQHAKSLLNADYVMDYYSTPRAAGGSHTMTYPHKRVTKQGYREVFNNPAEEIPPEVFLPVRDETEIVGADGHVYRGRFDLNSGDPNAIPSLEGRPTTPNRPKTSPIRRPVSGRPGVMARPKTAVSAKAATDRSQLQVETGRERPSSARERPMTSMGMRDDDDEGGMADNPPVVTIETVAELDLQPAEPPSGQDVQA